MLEKMTFEKPSWRLLAFSVSFLLLFLYLAFWQLDRAEDKKQLLAQAQIMANQEGEWLTQDMDINIGEPVRAEGVFDSDIVLLLDNRVLNGRVGYEVIQLFVVSEGYGALVNRGFVPGQTTRLDLPAVPLAMRVPQAIRGHAYLTELVTPDQNVSGSDSPWVIQVAKPAELESLTGFKLFPHVVRLDDAHVDALPRYWPVTTMTPERHMGYAVTWFTMALAILVMFGYSVVKQGKIDTE